MIIANMQYNERLSEYIRNLRKKKGISLNSFAFKNEIEPSTLSRIEKNQLELKISNLVKIANAFNRTPAEFLADFEKEEHS